MADRTASCSCGQLTVRVTGEPVRVSVCHCLACQQRTGSAFGYQARFARADVTITGTSTAWSRTADDGDATYTFHFCPECGSTVHYGADDEPETVAIAAGAFADPDFPAPQRTVWESRRHAWVTLPEGIDHDDPPDVRVPTPVELVRAMFDRMVAVKDPVAIEAYYDPEFELTTNGQVQDYATFAAGHERIYATDIEYAVEYDDDAWVQTASQVAGRVWITTRRPGQDPTRIEVVLVARLRGGRFHRVWELTWPDWSQLPEFGRYED